MRMMKNFSVLLLLALAGVPAAAADAPPAITAHRQAARPGDGPAMQDGGDAMGEVLPADGPGLPNRAAVVKAAERPEKGSARYLMVLWEAGTPIPGDPAKKIMKRVAAPDIPKLGGKVLFSRGSQRVIELPLKVVKKLRKHEAVVSLQRLWSGESRSEWAEPADTDTAAQSETRPANSRLAVRSDADTNLQWGPLTYGYDGSGNIKQTSTTANTDSYVYDSAGRLIQATVKGQTETYAYDAFGNMTAKGITGGTSTTIPVDGSSNRLIGPSYDAAGNVLSRDGLEAYEYDSFNMLSKYRRPLAAAPYTLEMVYDPDDERVGVLLPGDGSRWSVRDLGGQVIREYDGIRDGNNLFLMWQADYIRGEGGQLLAGETPVWQYNDQNGNGTTTAVYGGLRHYHLDHLGSVRLVTDAGKRTLGEHDYYPYGVTPTKAYQEELNPGTPHIDPMRYTGHQRDFLGYLNVENTDYLDYMHARYYDPKLGRFLSVDPVMDIKRALEAPQTWNRYAYVLNNPVRFTDPTGRYVCTGTDDPAVCGVIEKALDKMRQSAAALKKNDPAKADLQRVIKAFGRQGDPTTTISQVLINPPMPSTVFGQPGRSGVLGISLINIGAAAGKNNERAFTMLGGTLTHEGKHMLQPAVVNSSGPRSFLSTVFYEHQAYSLQKSYYSGLGQGGDAPDPVGGAFASANQQCGQIPCIP